MRNLARHDATSTSPPVGADVRRTDLVPLTVRSPTYSMAGRRAAGLVKNQNNRGRISNAAPVAVGFKLLTAARVDPTTLPNGSTTRSEHATR